MDLGLEIDSVLHSFGGRTILSDVYLKCKPRDIVGIIGRNGMGKSTLFKIIFGTLKADRSFMRIDGEIIRKHTFASGEIAFLPQFHITPKSMKVADAIEQFTGKESTDFLHSLKLTNIKDSKIWSLSEGIRRYLEINIVLESRSRYIILDEPFSSLSPIMVQHIKQRIEEKAECKGIILTDQRWKEVAAISTHLKLLENGTLRDFRQKDFDNYIITRPI